MFRQKVRQIKIKNQLILLQTLFYIHAEITVAYQQ